MTALLVVWSVSHSYAQRRDTLLQTYMFTVGTNACQATLSIEPMDSTAARSARMVFGTYSYNRKGVDIDLLGDTAYFINRTTMMCKLTELYADRTKVENYDSDTTGFWEIQITLDTTQKPIVSRLQGTWFSKDRKRTLPIQSQSCIGYLKIVHPRYDILIQYPVLPPPYQALQTQLQTMAQKNYTSSVQSARKDEEELAKMKKENKEYADEVFRYASYDRTSVAYLGDTLVSMVSVNYLFTGGAHGMTAQSGNNFYRSAGTANFRELQLRDLFRDLFVTPPSLAKAAKSPKDYIDVLNTILMRELRKQNAEWVKNGELKSLTKDLREGGIPFCLLQAGIAFYFNQYYAGPYAQGIFTVVVPYTTISDLVPASSPIYGLAQKK